MKKDVRIVELGEGKFVINHGDRWGVPCIFIEKANKPQSVGADASEDGLDADDVSNGAIVIQLGNKEAADILIEQIQKAFHQSANVLTDRQIDNALEKVSPNI